MNVPRILSLALIFTACIAQKPLEYVFPSGADKKERAEIAAQCEKGKILYGEVCAQCHAVQVDHKTLVPDFTTDQLENYNLRNDVRRHRNQLTEKTISEEELELVIFYLAHKIPNKPLILVESEPDH